MKNRIVTSIPSVLTLGNLSLGFAAMLMNNPLLSFWMILAGAVLDTFDGMVARSLNAMSEFGKQVDSLADLVTFGIAPAYLYYQYMLSHDIMSMIIIISLPVASALRLAIFNLSTNQTVSFKGLPTPACGIFFSSIPVVLEKNIIPFDHTFYFDIVMYALPLLFSFLMLSRIRLFSVKAVKNGWKQNQPLLIFMGVIIILLIIIKWLAIPISILLYVIFSLLNKKQLEESEKSKAS